jgi:hypothetical protein
MQAAGQRMGSQRAEQQMSQGAMQRAMNEIDRLQNQSGGQSTMANQGGNQGQSGQQPNGGQGQQPNGGQGGQGGERQSANGGGGPQSGENGPGQTGQQGPGGAGGRMQSSGSTMMESPGGPDGPNGENGPLGGQRSFVRIYDEKQTDTDGTTEKIGSKINPLGGGAKGSIDIKGPADINDPAFKTYQDVLEDSRRRAMEELTRQEIPPQYQDIVKEFYKEPARN